MHKTFLHLVRRFASDTRGSISIEVAIIVPILLWAFVAMWVFFDAYKTRSTTEKAAFTISDMLSRETNAINDDYLTSAKKLFDLLAHSDPASGLRVTVVSYSGALEDYVFKWSKVRGNINAMTGADMADLVDHLPAMAAGESLIIVETVSTYDPPLKVGLGSLKMDTFIFTRPRFAPQLVWSS